MLHWMECINEMMNSSCGSSHKPLKHELLGNLPAAYYVGFSEEWLPTSQSTINT